MSRPLSPVLAISAFLIAALQLTENQAVAVLLPQLGRLWPGRDVAWFIAAYAVGAATLPLAITARFPGFSGRPAIAAGLLLIALADALLARVPAFEAALGLRFAAGAGSGVVSFSLLASLAGLPRGRSRAVAAMTAGFLVALVVGVPLCALATHHLGVRSLFTALAAGAALLAATGYRVFPAVPDLGPPVSIRLDLRNFLLRPGPLLYGLLASLLIAAAIAGPVNLFSRHLQEGPAALDLPQVAQVYFLAGFGPLLGGWIAPRLVVRFGTASLAAAGALVLGLPLLLLPWAGGAAGRAALFLSLALVIETVRRSALQELMALLPAPGARTRYLTLRNLLANLGVAGGILAATTLDANFGFLAAGLLGAFLAVLSAGLTLGCRASEDPDTR